MCPYKIIFLTLIANAECFNSYNADTLSKMNTRQCTIQMLSVNATNTTSLTVVNVKDDGLLRDIYDTSSRAIFIRTFLSMKLDVSNEAYLISADNYTEVNNGLEDLIRDYYWNPRAYFVIISEKLSKKETICLFRRLHRLYVFSSVIITTLSNASYVFKYNFNESDHCTFTSSAIEQHNCEDSFKSSMYEMVLDETILKSFDRSKIPYAGCNLTYLIIPIIPNAFPKSQNNSKNDVGSEEVFYTIMKEMGFFNFNFVYASGDYTPGFLSENYTASGLMKLIEIGKIDGVMGGFILSKSRIGIFDFVYPYLADEMVFLVPKTQVLSKWKLLALTFTPTVWMLLFLTCLSFSTIALPYKVYGSGSKEQPIYVFFVSFGYLAGATAVNACKSSKNRMLLLSWLIFTWFIMSCYQSSLSSAFTKRKYNHQINSIDELERSQHIFYLYKNLYKYMLATDAFDFGSLKERLKLCNDVVKCLEFVANGNAFTLFSMVVYKYYEGAFLDQNYESVFHVLPAPVYYIFETAYMQKGHPDLERIRFLEWQILASSLHTKTIQDLTMKNTLPYLHKQHISRNEELTIDDLAGVYFLLFSGCFISFLVFVCEIIKHKCNIKILI